MKKGLILLLTALLTLSSLAACGQADKTDPAPGSTAAESSGESTSSDKTAVPSDTNEGTSSTEIAAAETEPLDDSLLQATDLAGVWKATSLEIENETIDTAKEGFRIHFEFEKGNKNVKYFIGMPGIGGKGQVPYQTDGYQILLSFSDSEALAGTKERLNYDPEKDIITGSFSFLGCPMIIERADDEEFPLSKEEKAEKTKQEIPPITGEAEALVGTWNISHAISQGNTVTAEEADLNETLKFEKDATASDSMDGFVQDGYWTFADGKITFLTEDGVLYQEYIYNSSDQTLEIKTDNIELYYKKK